MENKRALKRIIRRKLLNLGAQNAKGALEFRNSQYIFNGRGPVEINGKKNLTGCLNSCQKNDQQN